MKIKFLLPALVCAVVAMPLFAASYVVAPDDVFIQKSDTIVLARAVSSSVRETPERGIETVTQFTVGETLKGEPRATVQIRVPGGAINGRYKVIGGAPSFDAGAEYLLFLDGSDTASIHLTDFGLGVFSFTDDGQRRLVQRSGEIFGWDLDGKPHHESLRDANGFLDYIRGVARGGRPAATYVVTPPRAASTSSVRPPAKTATTYAGSTYTMVMGSTTGCPAGGCGGRWNGFPVNWNMDSTGEPGAPGTPPGKTAVQSAFGSWNFSGNGINYVLASNNANTNGILEASDHVNNIVFEKSLAGAGAGAYSCAGGGVLGLGGIQIAGPGTNTKNGELYFSNVEGDVSMNVGIANCTSLFTSGNFNTAVTHEFGHTLGFRHSDQNRTNGACDASIECSSSAVMRSSVPSGINGALQTWDQNAAAAVYGTPATCTPPSISAQPTTNASTINAGGSATLSVTAAGTAPLTYQWYTGTPGNTASPVVNGTTASIQVSPSTTTQYWVRVTGQCAPTVDSAGVTVTVNPVSCTAPQITGQPQGSTINSGAIASLAVTATGTSLTYQWYIGATGQTGSPLAGQTFASINVNPSNTTSYWVRVSNSCGTQDSTAATVTVNAGCAAIQIFGQPQPKSITQGSSTSLSVSASSTATPLTYQWYIGTPGDLSSPIPNATSSTLTVTPANTTIYYVRVTNSCRGTQDSNAAQVTVNPPGCPTITMATPSVAQNGNAYTLTAAPSGGSGLTVTWAMQLSGGGTQQVGTGLSIIVTPSATTTYVATARNSCGASLDVPVTITITPAGGTCAAPTLTQPADVTIPPGGSITLTVGAVGSGTLHYQWYEGAAPSTANGVGSDSPSFTTGPVAQTTQYWVRVTNDCGSGGASPSTASASSTTITVTTMVARRRAAHH